jgi:small subunit ribosomal protein S18
MSTTETGDQPSSAGASHSSSRPSSGYVPRSGGPAGAGKGRPMGGPGGRRPPPRRRMCRICADKQGGVDWKAVNFLRNFITERGKILGGRATGTCSKCQRQLSLAIKRARNMALVPTSPV